MERKTKRTITEVLNCDTGECIDANTFFKKPLDELTVFRSELQKAIEGFREPLFKCYYCKQKIRIRGGISSTSKRKSEIFHFAHLKDSDECHIKTKNLFTKEEVDRIKYNGAKESVLHQTLKENIAECLRRNQETKKEVSFVEVEKVIKDKVAKEWKKPDINAFFMDKRIAIELQLSTTWLDVITRRQHFYKEQGVYIFWVFNTFNPDDDVRKLTFNDVIYTNNQNAYVFDNETYKLSKSENDLILKCFYKTYYRDEVSLGEDWDHTFIKLSDLKFDENKFRIYYHNAEAEKQNVEQEIEDHISELQESKRLRIIEEQEKERKRKELELKNKELELKKKKKEKEKEQKIEDLKNEIKKIKSRKDDFEQEEQNAKNKLAEKEEIVSKSGDYANKIVKYLLGHDIFNKPFYDNDELLKSLKTEYAVTLMTASQIISAKNQEQAISSKNLLQISKLATIEISQKTYSCINHLNDWDFIKRNYSQIKTIHKDLVDGLFAEDEMKVINNDHGLNLLQFSKDILFLFDFSPRITELNENTKTNKEIIIQQEILIVTAKEEIGKKIVAHLKKEITDLETELKSYSERQAELKTDFAQKENELTIFLKKHNSH